MATAAFTRVVFPHGGLDCVMYQWTITDANDVGAPIPPQEILNSEVSWQVFGNFDSTGVIKIEGNLELDGTTDAQYLPLTAADGNALSFSADGIKSQLDPVPWERPHATTSPANLSVTVRAFVKRKKEAR